MTTSHLLSIRSHFRSLKDPRRPHRQLHRLIDIITMALCAVICGAESWEDVEKYGKSKSAWLASFLELPNGIPSHDTFERVFARLDPRIFQRCFVNWLRAVSQATGLNQIAIDGKTLRHTFDKATARSAFHLVSAWATASNLTLGQVVVDSKSNEITAVPKLLKLLDLSGALVTLDAMHCQTNTAAEIRQGDGDYVLAVKENQGRLYEDLQASFATVSKETAVAGWDQHTTTERKHGRQETRVCSVLTDLRGIRDVERWQDLKVLVQVYREREVQGKTTKEIHYYIGSRTGTAQDYNQWVRDHWRIENTLHWVLDVTFDEDQSRYRVGHGAENLALLRRIAVSLLKNQKGKSSIHGKRLRAGWDDTFLVEVLMGDGNNKLGEL
jgi:predicted transposase YbfD/YdcC